MNESVKSYVRYNLVRVAEVLVIIASVFFTMQYNIKAQGEMLLQLSKKNEEVTAVLHSLTITVATMQAEQKHIRKDLDKLERKSLYELRSE